MSFWPRYLGLRSQLCRRQGWKRALLPAWLRLGEPEASLASGAQSSFGTPAVSQHGGGWPDAAWARFGSSVALSLVGCEVLLELERCKVVPFVEAGRCWHVPCFVARAPL